MVDMSSDSNTTYKRYKRGTRKLLTWLKVNAPSQPSSGTSCSSRATDTGPIIVATHELVPLALSIATAKGPISLEILYVTKDAIDGRRKCLRWYQELARSNNVKPEVLESNHTHKHFLDRLQEVYDILSESYRVRQPGSKHTVSKLDADLEKMGNYFQHLDVEDTKEDGDQNELIEPGSGSTRKASKGTVSKAPDYQLDNGDEEKSFAIFCLFEDFASLRAQICKVWTDYKTGNFSFTTACLLTETAFLMYTSATENFNKAYTEVTTFESILKFSGLSDYLLQTRLAQWSYHNEPVRDDACTSGVRADPLCMQAWAALRDFKDVLPWIWAPEAARQHLGAPNIAYPGHPFNKTLIGLAKDLTTSIKALSAPFDDVLDIFTLNLTLYMSQYDMPIALVGMTSAYMGIYDVLEGDMEQGIKECDRIVTRVSDASIALSCFLKDECDEELYARPMDELIALTRRETDYWIFGTMGSANHSGSQFSKQLLGALPTLCGLHALRLAQRFHLTGIECCCAPSCLAMAHIYSALREQGLLNDSWSGMEFLIANQKKAKRIDKNRKTFCGDISPNSQTPALSRGRQYLMSLGIGFQQASRASPGDRPDIPRAGLEAELTTTNLYLMAANHLRSRMKNLDSIPTNSELHYDILRRLIKSGKPFHDPIIAEAWRTTKSLTSVPMLIVLQQAIVSGEQDSNFDYFHFFEICTRILDQLTKTAESMGLVVVSASDPDPVPSLGALALWQAAEHEQRVHQHIPSKRSDLLLPKAAGMIKFVIQRGSDQLCRASRDISSGSIADHLKPAVLYPAGSPPRFAVVDFDGIVFDKFNIHLTAEEKQHELDARKQQVARVLDNFEQEFDARVHQDDCVMQLEGTLQEELQTRLHKAGCASKAHVAIKDKRMVFSARDYTEAERLDMLNTTSPEIMEDVLKRGVRYSRA